MDRSKAHAGNPYAGGVVGGAVNGKAIGWGLSFLGLAVVIAAVPGSLAVSAGPRIALVTALALFGLILLATALVGPWMLRRSAKESGTGTCPVGARCACGAWNWKPRAACGSCNAPTAWTKPSGPSTR